MWAGLRFHWLGLIVTWTLTSKLDMPMSIWQWATDSEILYINVETFLQSLHTGIIVYTPWNKNIYYLFWSDSSFEFEPNLNPSTILSDMNFQEEIKVSVLLLNWSNFTSPKNYEKYCQKFSFNKLMFTAGSNCAALLSNTWQRVSNKGSKLSQFKILASLIPVLFLNSTE